MYTSMNYLADLLQFNRRGSLEGTWALVQWCILYRGRLL